MSMADKQKAKLFSKLRSQGSAFKTKGLGNKPSESGTRTEGGSETSGSRAEKQKTRDGEGSEDLDIQLTVAELAPAKKKPRFENTGPEVVPGGVSGVNPGDTATVPETGVLTSGESAPGTVLLQAADPPRAPAPKKAIGQIGKKTISELTKMAADIPDDKNWEKMRGSSLADNLRRRTALWGQVGMLIAGDGELANRVEREMRKMSDELAQRDRDLALSRHEINELQTRMAHRARETGELRESHKKLENELASAVAKEHAAVENLGQAQSREKAAEDRAKAAEKGYWELKRKVVELEVELGGRREEQVVIQEHMESEEYTDAVMGEVAKYLKKSWVITRNLTKADPDHSYDAFCNAFEDAPDVLEEETARGPDQEAHQDALADPAGVGAQDDDKIPEEGNQTAPDPQQA